MLCVGGKTKAELQEGIDNAWHEDASALQIIVLFTGFS